MQFFGKKTMENVRKHNAFNNIKRKDLFSVRTKLSYNKFFFGTFVSHRNEKKKQKSMNKLVYLSLSVLELSKIVMYNFWYDYDYAKYK